MSAHATQQTAAPRRADPQRAATHQPLAATHSRITQIKRLQRTVGNRALSSLLRAPVIQRKLEVSEPDDEFEREADRVADEVMRLPDNELHRKPDQISRKCNDCEEETVVQAKRLPGDPSISSGSENFLSVAAGRGEPLSDGARSYFEPRFGYDFTRVRVHTDANAATLSQSLGARAFTYRDHIYFINTNLIPATLRENDCLRMSWPM